MGSPTSSNILSEKIEGFEFIMCMFACWVYKVLKPFSYHIHNAEKNLKLHILKLCYLALGVPFFENETFMFKKFKFKSPCFRGLNFWGHGFWGPGFTGSGFWGTCN